MPVTAEASILVVDDDDEVRGLMTETLQDFGYRVVEANCAERALELLDDPSLRMLITDVSMPGMSGLDLADRAQDRRPEIKVIVMSGYFHPQPVRQRFLAKPFRLQELARAVRAELS